MLNGQLDAGDIKAYIETALPGVISEVSVGVTVDKDTWVVIYKPTATDGQKVQVASIIVALDLTLLKAQALYTQLYNAFDINTAAIEAAGFTYLGGVFHADEKGIRNIQSLMLGASYLQYPYSFYDKDSSWTFNSASDVVAMGSAVMGFAAGIENAAKSLRDALKQQSGETSEAWLARLQAWKDPR